MAKSYPDDCLQSYVGEWWIDCASATVSRGRLVWAFVPYIDQEPMVLIPQGRSSPTIHETAQYSVEPLRASNPPRPPRLPVAGLPTYPGEVRAVYRAKRRPVLVLSTGGPSVDRELRVGAARWQTNPTLLVAPFFGVDPGPRGGWRPEFVGRIRRCEYPQYAWDELPIGGSTNSSILNFGQIQAIGNHPNCYELTSYCLSEEALTIVDEWIGWLTTGKLDPNGILHEIRKGLIELGDL